MVIRPFVGLHRRSERQDPGPVPGKVACLIFEVNGTMKSSSCFWRYVGDEDHCLRVVGVAHVKSP